MRPESSPPQPFDFARLDFTRRAAPHELAEWMDAPCRYPQFRACLRDLGQVNRVTLAYRPTLRFLSGVVAQRAATYQGSSARQEPLRIVDVGSGGGDALRAIERWAKRRRVAVKLTGVDLNPHAARAAREFSPATSQIQWVTADALAFAQPGGIDVVISSLFTHHLEEPQITDFFAWMERVTRIGWLVNDLRRSRGSFVLFRALAHAARWHSFVRHDGPVSIRRSFQEEDWTRMLAEARVPAAEVKLQRWFPGRLCVARLKDAIR